MQQVETNDVRAVAEPAISVGRWYALERPSTSSTTGPRPGYRHVIDLRGLTAHIDADRDAKGSWTIDGQAARSLKGCSDIDLGCSPSTNTLPIRRLGLGYRLREDDPGRVDPLSRAHRREGRPDLHPARRVHVPLRERNVRGRADGRRRRPGRAVRGMAADRDRLRPGGHPAARRRALRFCTCRQFGDASSISSRSSVSRSSSSAPPPRSWHTRETSVEASAEPPTSGFGSTSAGRSW